MRDAGLEARSPKLRRITTTDFHHAEPIAPNHLARQFNLGRPLNRV